MVGHGYAGLNACRYLAAQGVSVILIESQSEDSYQAMGNEAGTPNASVLTELGVPEIDPIEYYNNWMVNSGYQANPGLMMKFCQNSGEASAVNFFWSHYINVWEIRKATYFPKIFLTLILIVD
ncbi:MAG: hypothetical protein LIP12_03745 [Clostridiales bacterium]|nr:hypothetical protein [Clostridiales bacterium]